MLRLLSTSMLAIVVLASRASAQTGRFPESWLGRWEGTLTTSSPPDSVRNRIPVSLTIAREDTGTALTWRTVFNADTVRGVRPYRLVVRDAARGWYGTDEGNGLVLEETWIAGSLISVFQVGDRVLESRYTLQGDTLVQDITWWHAKPVTQTHGRGPNAEQGAAVSSFRVEGRQRAVLTRRR